jgi:hypothetical protein
MYIGMFNLTAFTACVTTQYVLKYKDTGTSLKDIFLTDTNSLIILILGVGCYLFTFILFYFDPDPFNYFRYSFKRTLIDMLYYYFYAIMIIACIVLMVAVNSYAWAPIIPVAVLFLFTLISMPYWLMKENLICLGNLIIIMSFYAHRIFL